MSVETINYQKISEKVSGRILTPFFLYQSISADLSASRQQSAFGS